MIVRWIDKGATARCATKIDGCCVTVQAVDRWTRGEVQGAQECLHDSMNCFEPAAVEFERGQLIAMKFIAGEIPRLERWLYLVECYKEDSNQCATINGKVGVSSSSLRMS